MNTNPLQYRVAAFRDAGLEAKWDRTRTGAPAIFVRDPAAHHQHQRKTWWIVSNRMFEEMKRDGVVSAFRAQTLIADIFSVPA